ncbi:YpiB family protein [Tumebacillus sp. ITR2]|uniref:YpiB family protein n=1 Tax=Tumebacillus amylolyticus TaxID=2801339 RepID=A0ABS1JEV2_9BACL|nr:ReoY family proteolytic degradation factor [Tumebacillus amylolyticus]MBL0388519.1 YpiB family protein [Tumebacillus amylolyticus]
MGEVITIAEKKTFIKWFLDKYDLQNREAEWLLQYIASSDQLLERVHFIDNFRNLPKTILISTKCVQMTPFKFYKNKRVTSDVEKAFLDIHNNPNEDIYIGLFFKERTVSPEYAAVLERNPMDDTKETIDALVSLQAELILDHAFKQFRLNSLYERIDHALAVGDQAGFLELTTELKTVLEPDA